MASIQLPSEITETQSKNLSAEELNALPFGAIRLDEMGRVHFYNVTEALLARRDPVDVVGKDFFREIAPCTNVQSFRGELDRLTKRGHGSAELDYEFSFPWGKTRVRIRLMVVNPTDRWIFVTKS
jgi:two-component system, chemotaxis family, sensor kinase Cph1